MPKGIRKSKKRITTRAASRMKGAKRTTVGKRKTAKRRRTGL